MNSTARLASNEPNRRPAKRRAALFTRLVRGLQKTLSMSPAGVVASLLDDKALGEEDLRQLKAMITEIEERRSSP